MKWSGKVINSQKNLLDYRTFKKKEDFGDYCTLFEDCGWKHITGTKSSGYQYFKSVDGGEDIFSDTDSKAGRYKRISHMWMALASSYLPIFAVLISTGSIDKGALLNPKLLYYTPGLWDKSGAFISCRSKPKGGDSCGVCCNNLAV